ncbi:MAG: glycosyltransferase [Ruminococcaceae bacterium]|nr:glycosyltransferase [Oscillospiraceae bacterium]
MNYSVLMSIYHKEQPEFFQAAVESMLNQTVPPSDFVIVCDGALTKELDAVIAAFCQTNPQLFQIIRLPENQGLGLALKEGLPHCREALVARMDSDDIATKDRMHKQLQFLKEHPEISVVGAQIAEFEETPDRIIRYRMVPEYQKDILHKLKFSNPVNHVTTVFRKEHVLNAGSYPDHPGFEDYHLWTKLLSEGYVFHNLPDTCCFVRADAHMLKRRDGWTYFKNTVKMEKLLRKKKLISPWQYLVNITVRFGGTVLLPHGLRKKLFSKLMRKQPAKEQNA